MYTLSLLWLLYVIIIMIIIMIFFTIIIMYYYITIIMTTIIIIITYMIYNMYILIRTHICETEDLRDIVLTLSEYLGPTAWHHESQTTRNL